MKKLSTGVRLSLQAPPSISRAAPNFTGQVTVAADTEPKNIAVIEIYLERRHVASASENYAALPNERLGAAVIQGPLQLQPGQPQTFDFTLVMNSLEASMQNSDNPVLQKIGHLGAMLESTQQNAYEHWVSAEAKIENKRTVASASVPIRLTGPGEIGITHNIGIGL